jgi:serine/threonine-protein kinase
MSPEQLLSAKHVDSQCDLWSLAVVAYRATTGHLPFTGDTLGALALKVHEARFLPASAHRPDVPPALDAWFVKAFQRDPALRFASLKELVQSLSRAAADPSVTELPSFPTFTPGAALSALSPLGGPASGITAPSRAQGESRSLKISAAVAASVALVLVGAVITLLLTRPRASSPTIAVRASVPITPSTVSSATPPTALLAEISTASAPVAADSAEPEAVPPVSSVSASATARPTPTSIARAPQIKASATSNHPKDRGF